MSSPRRSKPKRVERMSGVSYWCITVWESYKVFGICWEVFAVEDESAPSQSRSAFRPEAWDVQCAAVRIKDSHFEAHIVRNMSV